MASRRCTFIHVSHTTSVPLYVSPFFSSTSCGRQDGKKRSVTHLFERASACGAPAGALEPSSVMRAEAAGRATRNNVKNWRVCELKEGVAAHHVCSTGESGEEFQVTLKPRMCPQNPKSAGD